MSKNYAYLAGGCFWCLDAAYRMLNGVENVVSGYAGGHKDSPTYEEVCSGETGHTETVKIEFDPKIISYDDILDIFFSLHDPTTLNRQGNDVGTQYRSAIFYVDNEQKKLAESKVLEVKKLWNDPIVTEINELKEFYRAEEYHQDYFNKNPANGYCQIIINPKLHKLRQKYANRLKKQV